jgi:type II secretory pathway component PulM
MSELLDRIRSILDNLSPREQMLVSAAGVMLVLALITFAVVMPIINLANSSEQRVESAERQIEAMRRLYRDYAEIQSKLSGVEDRISSQQGSQNIRTLLETLAQQSSVRIASMEERQAGKNDAYVETKVEVSLKNVSLSQTIKYLHNIESANQQLSVKSLRIKGKQDKTQLLDVTFSVSSFEPA